MGVIADAGISCCHLGLLLMPGVIADNGGYCQQWGLLSATGVIAYIEYFTDSGQRGLWLTMRVIAHVEYSDAIGSYC